VGLGENKRTNKRLEIRRTCYPRVKSRFDPILVLAEKAINAAIDAIGDIINEIIGWDLF
jgi:hypothetical protein